MIIFGNCGSGIQHVKWLFVYLVPGTVAYPMHCRLVARALYDYAPQTEDELLVKEGEMLLITDDSDPDWWHASQKPVDTFAEVQHGLVPATYVEQVFFQLTQAGAKVTGYGCL